MTNNKEIEEKNRRFIAEKVKKNYQGWLHSTSVSYNSAIINSIEQIKHTLNKGKLGLMIKYILFLSIIANLGIWYNVLIN